jgi:hypothetical protein
LDDLEEKAAGFETSKKELKKLIKDLEGVVRDIGADHPETEQMGEDLRKARRELREATLEGKRTQKEVKDKTKRLEDLRQATEDGEKLIGKLEEAADAPEEAGEAPQDKDALKAEIDSRRAKLREDQGDLKELDDGIKEKEKEYTALRGRGRELAKSIQQLEAQRDAPGEEPESHEAIKEKIKEERKKQRDLEDEIKEKKDDLGAAEEKVKDHEEERRDPEGRKKKQEDAAKKERQKKVKEAIARTTQAMGTLLGKDSKLSSQTQKEISAHLGGMDESQLEQFALDFENDLGDLTKKDPQSEEVNDIANGVAKMGFSTEGITDPETLATRLAQIAYTRNVIANPMIVGGKALGQTDMGDAKARGERALESFEQFKGLNGILRRDAASRIAQELRGLDDDTDKAKELKAIMTGLNTAHVVDTGDALPGRPQPNKGAAALIRKMVEAGDVGSVFAPSEDMFSDTSQKAFEGALGAMDDADLAEFIVGDDKNHPYAQMADTLRSSEGDPVMKEFVKNFMREDWMQDIWADRAMRDVMEANGDPLADDPEYRAEKIEEAKREVGPRRQQRMEAINRIQEAKDAGEEPDEKDVALAKGLDAEDGAALRENAGGILDKLKEMGKRVMSPAVAVLNHFRNTGEADVKRTETAPHPDENAKEPRSKEDRDKAREEPSRVQLKSERLKLKSQRDKVGPEERAKYDEKIKELDEKIKTTESEGGPEEAAAPEKAPKTREEFRKKFDGSTWSNDDSETGGEWHVGDLIHQAESTKEVEEVPIADIEESLSSLSADEEVGSKEFRERADKADLKYPVILMRNEDGSLDIVDGSHRAWKAREQKVPLKARILEPSDLKKIDEVTDDERKKWEEGAGGEGGEGGGEKPEEKKPAKGEKRLPPPKVELSDQEQEDLVMSLNPDMSKEQLREWKAQLRENPKAAKNFANLQAAFEDGFQHLWEDPKERAAFFERMQRDSDYREQTMKWVKEVIKDGGGSARRVKLRKVDPDEHQRGDVWQTKNGWYRKDNSGKVSGPFRSQERARRGGASPGSRLATQWLAKHRASRMAEDWMAHLRSIHPDDPNRPIVFLDAA